MLDREVVCLQGIRLHRLTQDDRGIVVLVFEGQELFRADGMEGLVGLCDEAGLGELGGRHALCVLDAITCQPKRKQLKETTALIAPPPQHSDIWGLQCQRRQMFFENISKPRTVGSAGVQIDDSALSLLGSCLAAQN